MKILIINHYAGSLMMGMEFRAYYLAKEWIESGYEVHILAADYSHLRNNNPQIKKDFEETLVDGIHYHWVKTGTYNGNGVKRALTMVEFIYKTWTHSKYIVNRINPDVVITASTYHWDTYIGQRIKKLSSKKIRLIHEVRDMWPRTLIEISGMSAHHPFVMAIQFAENSAYLNSDKIVALSPFAKQYMVEHGMDEQKFVVIPNGIVIDDWVNPSCLPIEHETVLKKLKEEGKFIIGYFGGHALSNALDTLVECANRVQEPDFHFVLVGNGVQKQELMKKANTLQLKNITFLDPIEKAAVPSLCEQFDAIYIGALKSPLYRFGISFNKMYDSLMAGKPIIYAITAPEEVLEQLKFGITVDANDIDGVICAINKIKQLNEDEKKQLKKAAHEEVENNYNYKLLAEKYVRIFQ